MVLGAPHDSKSRHSRVAALGFVEPGFAEELRRLGSRDLWRGWSPSSDLWYRLGEGLLNLRTDVAAFADRFQANYQECSSAIPTRGSPNTLCDVRLIPDSHLVVMRLKGPARLDHGFVEYMVGFDDPTGTRWSIGRWTTVESSHPVGRLAYANDEVSIESSRPWQVHVGGLAVAGTLASQQHVAYFHGAAASVAGRGVLLLGGSGSGKTSVSLALAARGHPFHGDDLVGLRKADLDIVPVRRTAHIRAGPSADGVRERFADRPSAPGASRRPFSVSDHFPAAESKHRSLHSIVFLRSFSEVTRLESFRPGIRDIRRLTPLAASLFGPDPASKAMEFVSLLTRRSCYLLDAESPDAAASVIEDVIGSAA